MTCKEVPPSSVPNHSTPSLSWQQAGLRSKNGAGSHSPSPQRQRSRSTNGYSNVVCLDEGMGKLVVHQPGSPHQRRHSGNGAAAGIGARRGSNDTRGSSVPRTVPEFKLTHEVKGQSRSSFELAAASQRPESLTWEDRQCLDYNAPPPPPPPSPPSDRTCPVCRQDAACNCAQPTPDGANATNNSSRGVGYQGDQSLHLSQMEISKDLDGYGTLPRGFKFVIQSQANVLQEGLKCNLRRVPGMAAQISQSSQELSSIHASGSGQNPSANLPGRHLIHMDGKSVSVSQGLSLNCARSSECFSDKCEKALLQVTSNENGTQRVTSKVLNSARDFDNRGGDDDQSPGVARAANTGEDIYTELPCNSSSRAQRQRQPGNSVWEKMKNTIWKRYNKVKSYKVTATPELPRRHAPSEFHFKQGYATLPRSFKLDLQGPGAIGLGPGMPTLDGDNVPVPNLQMHPPGHGPLPRSFTAGVLEQHQEDDEDAATLDLSNCSAISCIDILEESPFEDQYAYGGGARAPSAGASFLGSSPMLVQHGAVGRTPPPQNSNLSPSTNQDPGVVDSPQLPRGKGAKPKSPGFLKKKNGKSSSSKKRKDKHKNDKQDGGSSSPGRHSQDPEEDFS